MKLIKHFYYPYFYIEKFNGSIATIFFLDDTFYFEDEGDLFLNKKIYDVFKKEKKVIEELDNTKLKSLNDSYNYNINTFFNEFF